MPTDTNCYLFSQSTQGVMCSSTFFPSCIFALYKCALIAHRFPKSGWLKLQKCAFSQFWKLKVQDQGSSMVGVRWGLFCQLSDSPPQTSLLLEVTRLYFVWTGSCLSFRKKFRLLDSGSSLMTALNLNCHDFHKWLVTNYSHTRG